MFICFHKIRFMNFLSTGNEWTEIQLDRSESTLILGKNGGGKSTFIDAICYALYGKPYRNINKPQLVNSITGKNLLVELEFSIGQKKYLIRRGMKYNVFEVTVNGQLINQSAASKEYQDHLEKNIIKMSYKTFCQVIVLGTANFTPFMQLQAHHRREVIEDMLDLQIFSKMNNLLKDQVNQTKQDISDNSYEIRLISEKVRMYKEKLNSIRQNNEDIISSRMSILEDTKEELKELEAYLKELNAEVDELLPSMAEYKSLISKREKYSDAKKDLVRKRETHLDHIKFFHDNDSCPTCKQDIESDFKENYTSGRNEKIGAINEALEELDSLLLRQDIRIEELELTKTKIQSIQKQISSVEIKVYASTKTINSYEREISDLRSKTQTSSETDAAGMIKLLDAEKGLKTKHEALLIRKQTQDHASMMLKDGGIKTKIIKQYIPVINGIVNKYLSAMDFFVNFELNEKFEEVIKSRNRDEFSYNSFSEGEKARLDLALMLTWRALAKLRNSASTNLLILDEVFDGSLDGEGSDDLLNILTSDIAGPTPFDNIFVISHKSDALYDKFHSVIQFKKIKNFSKIV